MIWLLVEDIENYTNENQEKYKKKYEKTKIILFPSNDDIKNNIDSDTMFIAPYSVPKEFKNFIPQVRIYNKHGVLTSQEHKLGVSVSEALETRLGLNIIQSSYKMDNVGGAKALKEWTKEYITAYKNNYRAKAIMLAGLPGTGKTYFAKCFAGETERKLIFLNLSALMSKDEPIEELYKIHEYLDTFSNDKYVILLDEIEKMIGNGSSDEKQLLGAFLTIMNEMNTPSSKYKFDAIYIATANNLNSILDENPEFLRRGRFDELFFLNLPLEDDAKDIFTLYSKVYNLESIIEELTLDEVVSMVEDKYKVVNSQANRFPYTPAEIETFFKLLDFKRKAEKELNQDTVEEVIDLVIPLIKSAKEGINKMVAQKELFKEI